MSVKRFFCQLPPYWGGLGGAVFPPYRGGLGGAVSSRCSFFKRESWHYMHAVYIVKGHHLRRPFTSLAYWFNNLYFHS